MIKKVEVKNLFYKIPHSHYVLEDISFNLEAGQFLGVLGRNGAGKTTLMDLLMGFRPHTEGSVEIFGEDPRATHRNYLKKICFISQEVQLKGDLEIAQYLKLLSQLYPTYSKEDEVKLLKTFSLDKKSKIDLLSTGQQKKVQVVAALACNPEILLVDEITAVLDPETRGQFFKILQEYKKERNLIIVLATNIAEDLITQADRVLFISENKGSLHEPSEVHKLFHLDEVA